MPFFFMISGYLYKHITIKDEISKSAKSLLLPYLFFNLILVVIYTLLYKFDRNIVFNILIGNQEELPARWFCPLWFVISLFSYRIICSLIKDNLFPIVATIIFIVSCVLFYTNNIKTDRTSDYFQWQTSIICMPFFLIGTFVRKYKCIEKIAHSSGLIKYVLLPFVTIIAIFVGSRNGFVNVFTGVVGDDILIFYITSIMISFSVMTICYIAFTKSNQIVTTISNGTILILGLHVMFIDGIIYKCNMNLFIEFTIPIIVLIMCYILIVFVMNTCPPLLGKHFLDNKHLK